MHCQHVRLHSKPIPAAVALTMPASMCVMQVLVGIYFFVAVTGSLLGIKKFEYALLLVPLAVGVLVFHVLVRSDSTCIGAAALQTGTATWQLSAFTSVPAMDPQQYQSGGKTLEATCHQCPRHSGSCAGSCHHATV